MSVRKFLAFSALSFSLGIAFATGADSTQAHASDVTQLSYADDSVFSSGNDGFLIKWTSDDMGEHFQVSDLAIKMMARSPNGTDVAVYETDGGAINRISVWNWKTHAKKYTVKMPATVTSLSYSARGNFIFCGTASSMGALVLNASSGSVMNGKLKESTGIVNFITTSDTENTAVMYSPNGTLSYYNLKSGARKAKFGTEENLSGVTMFNKSIFLAGKKDGRIFIIQGTSGKNIATFNASNAMLIDSMSKDDLYYIVSGNGQFSLFKVSSEGSKSVSAPLLVRTCSGLKPNEKITSASFEKDFIYAGTSAGNIYKFEFVAQERVDSIIPITEKMYERIFDVASAGDGFYFLTGSSVFKSSYESETIEEKGRNDSYTDIVPYKNGAVLWSRGTRKSPVLCDFSSGTQKILFNPNGIVQKLRVSGDLLVEVESNSSVISYDLVSGKREVLYGGTSIQDAVLLGENDLYVAKTKSTPPASALVYVNRRTKETVPLSIAHEIVYSLAVDDKNPSKIFGIALGSDTKGKLSTSIFEYDVRSKSTRSMMPIPEEDGDAFIYLNSSVLYTNLGKALLRSYNLSSSRDFMYKRSASLPLKVARNGGRIVVLNRDGSVSWYNSEIANVLSDWYLTTDGSWMAF